MDALKTLAHAQDVCTSGSWNRATYKVQLLRKLGRTAHTHFKNEKEQPPWQFYFEILEPSIHLQTSFVLYHLLELKYPGDRR